jgi:hypothetical protein
VSVKREAHGAAGAYIDKKLLWWTRARRGADSRFDQAMRP